MATNFCPNCGATLEPNENFCTNCGAKIIRDEQPQPTYTPPESTPVESTSLSAVKNHMRKILALIGILVIVGVAAYFASNQSDEAIGEFYLGMSKDEADRKLGAGKPQGAGYVYSYGSGEFWLRFDPHSKVDCINFWGVATVKTKKGIHVGSTLDEVSSAYGNDYEFVDLESYVRYVYTFDNFQLNFWMNTKTNRVTGIELERYSRR